MALDIGVCKRNDRVVSVSKHVYGEAICETLDCGMEVAQHSVTALPPHNLVDVWVHLQYEERHLPYCLEKVCNDLCRDETKGGSRDLYNDADGRNNFGASYLMPFMPLIDEIDGGVTAGTVIVKIHHLEMQGHHRTTLGFPCLSLPE